MSRISVRGIAVASATAVTTVGAVVGVASGSEPTAAAQPVADAMALDSFTAGHQADAQVASLTEQVQSQQAAADAAAKQAAAEAARKQAAADAAAKKAAADAKAKAEHDAQLAASRAAARAKLLASTDYSVSGIQAMAQAIIGNTTQYQCFSWIVSHESGWNYKAVNPSTGAYGLVQALPGSKMASVGADWQTNPATQIKWGLGYMNDRYGSPCGAQSFWEANGWY